MPSSRSACGCWSRRRSSAPAQYYATLRDQRPLTPAERYGEALVADAERRGRHRGAHAAANCRRSYPQLTMLYSALGQALAAAGQTGCLAGAVRTLEPAVSAQRAADRALRRDPDAGRAARSRRISCCSTCSTTSSPRRRRSGSRRSPPAPPATRAMPTTTWREYDLAGGDLPLANQQLELALASPNLSRDAARALPRAARGGARLAARAAGLASQAG